MSVAAQLLKSARRSASLTQSDLAQRLGISQAAIAQLEGPKSNPTVWTLERSLGAADHRLEMAARPRIGGADETLVARQLGMTPAERVRAFEAAYASVRDIARAGARARGELA